MKLQHSTAVIDASIEGINYKPCLRTTAPSKFPDKEIESALSRGTFILEVNGEPDLYVSRWVSPKRTRSYPLARVYDTLGSPLRKVTIIPIVKDEGIDGDRDFLQWDTISLMSLLNVYVIVSYHSKATKSGRYQNKVTRQKLNAKHILTQVSELRSFHSSALHWNLMQLEKLESLGRIALNQYTHISRQTKVDMHSFEKGLERLGKTTDAGREFKSLSRELSRRARHSESTTVHASEDASWNKGKLDIKNHLGGVYYFTVDQINMKSSTLELIEVKHSRRGLPSINDIKDALIKLILYTNLKSASIENRTYAVRPILKLVSNADNSVPNVANKRESTLIKQIHEEASINGFSVEYYYFVQGALTSSKSVD